MSEKDVRAEPRGGEDVRDPARADGRGATGPGPERRDDGVLAEPRGYDAVRAALLERGYLETPLDRLFIGRGFDPRAGTLRGRAASAALAALVAGPLLGVLLAAVIVIEGRGAVPTWPDGVLYALLFAPVLGVLVGLAEALAGLAIRAVGRARPGLSPRTAALVAGLAVAAAFAVYLGVWWLRGGGGISTRDILALLVLAAGAGFAGRVISAAALVQAMRAVGRAPLRRRPRTVALLLGLALAIAGVVAGASAWAARATAGVPVEVRAGAPARAILVGWDGLSLELARGLARVEPGWAWPGAAPAGGPGGGAPEGTADGTHALVAIEPVPWRDPVAAWTTLATGTTPDVHGLGGMELAALRGTDAPMPSSGLARGPLQLLARLWPVEQRVVRSGVRRTPAAWEITADARKTAVVGWWGTWPATSPGHAGGYVVSDGALAALRRGRGVAEAVWPPAWGASRAPAWLATATREAEAAGVPASVRAPGAGGEEDWDGVRHEALVADLFAITALREALGDPEVAAAFVYLPGLDIVRERGLRGHLDPFAVLEAVRRHAAAVQPRLAAVLGLAGGATGGAAGEGAVVAIAGLPGRTGEGETGLLRMDLSLLGGAGDARALAVAGAGGGDGDGPVPCAPHDVAPTWLAAAGYTVDERMTGRSWGAPVPRRLTRVQPAAAPPPAEALEGDVLDRLRSLGYVR